MTNEWKNQLLPEVVAKMAENANFKNGVPVIAAITRAGILAGLTNEQVAAEVKKIHENGTPLHCISWYRSNLGPRKTSGKNLFQEALNHFNESGQTITDEDYIEIAKANLGIINSARGADLSVLSKYEIIGNYKQAQDEKRQAAAAEKMKATQEKQAAKEADKAAKELAKADKAKANELVGAAVADVTGTAPTISVDPNTGMVDQNKGKKLIKK